MDGIFAPLLGNMVLQNVPFSITDHVICIPYKADAGAEKKIMIPVNRKASKFYVLHSASYPTGGQWITYTIHFADGSVQDFPVNASENKLVADYHYANPLQSASTRLAWTDPIRGRGVYVMQLDLAETREVTGFEIGNPSKMGLHMLLAISCI